MTGAYRGDFEHRPALRLRSSRVWCRRKCKQRGSAGDGTEKNAATALADLKGARIACVPGLGNITLAKAALAKAGLKDGDYTLDQMEMAQHINVIKSGQYDAAYTLEPGATMRLAMPSSPSVTTSPGSTSRRSFAPMMSNAQDSLATQ